MTSTSSVSPTSTHPYASAYVCQLLQIQEATLKNLAQVLKLTPQLDANTQQLNFNQNDLDILKRAIDLHRQGKPLSEIVQILTATSTAIQSTQVSALGSTQAYASQTEVFPEVALSSVVEAISHSKEFILNEMSRLLDDRLAGLDEVVVELIRTKSENDALRSKITSLSKEKQQLQDELDSFKPVQFGFYKKVKP
jgi:DNA-binding transcriptional MerR regulator